MVVTSDVSIKNLPKPRIVIMSLFFISLAFSVQHRPFIYTLPAFIYVRHCERDDLHATDIILSSLNEATLPEISLNFCSIEISAFEIISVLQLYVLSVLWNL